MKTSEVNENLIGKRCEIVRFGLRIKGRIVAIDKDTYSVRVKVKFDTPQRWGTDLYTEEWNWARKCDEFGSLENLRILPEHKEPNYETVVVTFAEKIPDFEKRFFDDPAAWGGETLKEWIDSYESSRFTPLNERTVVITSEYNMEAIIKWLRENTPLHVISRK